MKNMIIGTIVALSLIAGFTMVDFWESPSADTLHNSTLEKTYIPEIKTNSSSMDADTDQGDAILSFPSIVSLCLVVIGIVAFRQNSYI